MVPEAGVSHSLRLAQGAALEPHWGSIHYCPRFDPRNDQYQKQRPPKGGPCFWQITLIWIPMHPGVKGGVHFGMGRGAFSERGGAFEMCLFTFVVYILASNRKKHKGIRRKLAELFVKKQKLRLAAGRSFCMQWCVDQNLAICSGVMEVTVATASLTVSSKS